MNTPLPTGLDYLMHRLESDIRFADKRYKEEKIQWEKDSDTPHCETAMIHHKTVHDDLLAAYNEIKHLHTITRCEGQDGDWVGDWIFEE